MDRDPFENFDTEYTVRKALTAEGGPEVAKSQSLSKAVGAALERELAPIFETIAALNERLDRVEESQRR